MCACEFLVAAPPGTPARPGTIPFTGYAQYAFPGSANKGILKPQKPMATTGAGKKSAKKTGSPTPVIPDKLYFRIGEVAELCTLPAYVLRFWETEFPQLKPVKGSTGQRMYRQKDVEYVLRIKKLLYDEGFTIPGARAQLKAEAKPAKLQAGLLFPSEKRGEKLKKVRQGLQEILGMLSKRR
jgi:DNA-binding transcriptional MerR regulator